MENEFEVVAKEASGKAANALQVAEHLNIQSQGDAAKVLEFTIAIKRDIYNIEEKRKSFTKPLNDTVSNINAFFKGPVDLLRQAEKIMKDKIQGWDDRKAAEAAALQAKLNAEKEKENLKLEKRADKLEAAGKSEKADSLRMTAATNQAPVVSTPTDTTSYRDNWDFELIDINLVPEIHNGIRIKTIDEVAVRKIVKMQRNECTIPGIKVVNKKSNIVRFRA